MPCRPSSSVSHWPLSCRRPSRWRMDTPPYSGKQRTRTSFSWCGFVTLATSYFRTTYRSTIIGAAAFHFRVRNGNGWDHCAEVTRRLPLNPRAVLRGLPGIAYPASIELSREPVQFPDICIQDSNNINRVFQSFRLFLIIHPRALEGEEIKPDELLVSLG